MNKLLLTATFLILGIATSWAQETTRIGITAGYVNGQTKVKINEMKGSDGESGFYGGLIVEIPISEKFKVQPELLYTNINDFNFLQIPIMAKFYPVDRFYFQAGPQLTYTLDKIGESFTKFNIGLGGGFGYDIVSGLYANMKYVFQLNNYFTGSDNYNSKIDFLSVGLGYKFN